MLMGSVFMSALRSEKRVRNESHFFSPSSHLKEMIFWLVRSQVQFTCSVSSVPHIKTGKASLLAVLLFIVGCLTCFSITIHSRERLSPLWKPVGPLLGEKAALPREEVKCLCSVVGRHSAVGANVCWCWGTLCCLKEVLSHSLRNVRSVHLKKANIAS